MTLQDVIKTASEISTNPNIITKGLRLVYHLPSDVHRDLDQELFLKTNNNIQEYKWSKTCEVVIGGIYFEFIAI